MRGKILFAQYDETTGISTVCKQTKYGTFTKSVRVAEEDKDIANRFDGCYFAELKCDIAAYKRKAHNMRERALGAEHVANVMRSNIYMGPEETEFAARLAKKAWELADKTRETYNLLVDSYYALVENTLRQRREMRDKINRRNIIK